MACYYALRNLKLPVQLPLMTIIDYCGYRVIAGKNNLSLQLTNVVSLLPINDTSLIYGMYQDSTVDTTRIPGWWGNCDQEGSCV